jgi:hypothetical protein
VSPSDGGGEPAEGFQPLVVLEFSSTANQAAIEWLLARLQASKAEGGADLQVQTIYLQHNKVGLASHFSNFIYLLGSLAEPASNLMVKH